VAEAVSAAAQAGEGWGRVEILMSKVEKLAIEVTQAELAWEKASSEVRKALDVEQEAGRTVYLKRMALREASAKLAPTPEAPPS
jgi:hypothetical protein